MKILEKHYSFEELMDFYEDIIDSITRCQVIPEESLGSIKITVEYIPDE